MDRKNGSKQSTSNSSRRKLSIRSNGAASVAAESKDAKADRVAEKVDCNSNVPLQHQQPQQYLSNFASVHRPRQLSSIAAIRRTAGQNGGTDVRDSLLFPLYGVEADRQYQQHQNGLVLQQSRYQLSKGGPSQTIQTSRRPEPYGTSSLGRTNAKVAVLPSCKEPSANGLLGRIVRPVDYGVIGENNGRIFNQPSLPLPVQIPNPPYAHTSAPAMDPAASSHYGRAQLQQPQHQQQQHQLQRPQQQTPLSQKTDYLQQPGAIRQGVNQKSLSSNVSLAETTGAGEPARRPPTQAVGSVTGNRLAKQHSVAVPAAAVSAAGKLTPKLLNDIYEKHLLSQTTFEVGSRGAAVCSTVAQEPRNPPAKPSTETSRTLTKSDTRLRATAAFGGGAPQKTSGKEGSSTATVAHNYDHARAATRMPVPGEDNLYECVRSNYHIYEKIDSRRSSLSGLPLPSTASLEQYVRPDGPQPSGQPPPLHPRPKSHPAVGIDQHTNDEPAVRTPPAPPTRQSRPLEQQKSIHTKMVASNGYAGSSLSPIQERPPLPPASTLRAIPQRSASTRSERVNIALETAKAIATAAYIERAAQRLASGGSETAATKNGTTEMSANGGFCGAIQRTPPPVPAGLARRMANRENIGLGKVKVMLRVSDDPPRQPGDSSQDQPAPGPTTTSAAAPTAPTYLTVDKKKRQVTLTETTLHGSAATAQSERGPMVSAPKMFAFDALFTTEDSQQDICGMALSEVIPAVLEGSDGCLLSLGYPGAGQSRTMFGTVTTPPGDLGAIPCAISWLYKGINEKRQKSGARFSVRVSALGVNATKPGSSSRDLLAGHATESDDSPGMYLRGDFLGRPTELRAPTAERAALFLDLALSGRSQCNFEPALIYTLHVYQYSLSGKRGVEGGRSRLHLIDLGGCANRNGGLPLSGIGNVLLAILSGQKHPPNRDHPLTPLLRDCLAPITCHVAVVAHVSHSQTHTDTLTTIQLASRIHRMRRRLQTRNHLLGEKGLNNGSSGHQSGGSSEGPDPSSSDFSQDTVIYMGPCDDPTDGEHPPVYLPSLNSGDNRCAMNKVLKGTVAEKPSAATPSPKKKVSAGSTSKAQSTSNPATGSAVGLGRTDSLKRNQMYTHQSQPPTAPELVSSSIQIASQHASPKVIAGAFKHVSGVSKGSNIPTPKGSPMRRSNAGPPTNSAAGATAARESPSRQISEEKWIDGPRVSKSKVHEARHLLREINHVKKCETWVDGPRTHGAQNPQTLPAGSGSAATAGAAATAAGNVAAGYGFMDTHKKNMIRQWVENQSIQLLQQSMSANNSPMHSKHHATYSLPKFKPSRSDEDGFLTLELDRGEELVNPIAMRGFTAASTTAANSSESHVRTGLKQAYSLDAEQTPVPMVVPAAQPMIHPQLHQPVYASVCTAAKTSHVSTTTVTSAAASLHDNHSERSRAPSLASERASHTQQQQTDPASAQEEEDQDSGPSEVPPALPLMDPLGSREISHESIHMLCSRHASRDDAMSVHSHNSHNIGMMDCGLQVTEDEIAKAMKGEHPLSALSHGELSIVSSFNVGGDVFSDCVIGESMRSQFDQLARLREIFTSQLAMAEVTPSFRLGDTNSVYSEPAYRFTAGPGSVCSEPAYRPPSPRCRDCRQSLTMSRTPSQSSLPSLTGIVAIAGMEQYASLRHPDGASDPNLPKLEKTTDEYLDVEEQPHGHIRENPLAEILCGEEDDGPLKGPSAALLPQQSHPTLPLLPLSTPEAYDSGHDSTPRTSKHSGISRRAESGYHSVGTVRDSDESSFGSAASRAHQKSGVGAGKKRNRADNKSLCHWLRNPFNCTYPDTEGEISDF